MKKYLFFTVVLLLVNVSMQGQQYQRIFSESTTYFTIRHGVIDHHYAATEKSLRLGGDTLINSHQYKIASLKETPWHADTNYFYVVGYFREDSTSTKAWFLGRFDTTETLIMDLSLKVGDTLNIPGTWSGWCDPSVNTVTSVDTVNGRKEIGFDKSCFLVPDKGLKFIEGVGPNYALFFLMQNEINWDSLTCFSHLCYFSPYKVCQVFHGDTIVYTQNSNFSDGCDNDWVSIDKLSLSQSISLFPNPGTNKMHIKGLDEISFSSFVNIEVFDMMGRKIAATKIQPVASASMEISSGVSGLMQVRISDDAGDVIAMKKWMKR